MSLCPINDIYFLCSPLIDAIQDFEREKTYTDFEGTFSYYGALFYFWGRYLRPIVGTCICDIMYLEESLVKKASGFRHPGKASTHLFLTKPNDL